MGLLIELMTEKWLPLLLTAIISYLLGSISWAILVTEWFSQTDIREVGSGNAGTTNVLRSQGKWPALITTVGDLSKAALSVCFGWFSVQMLGGSVMQPEWACIAGEYVAGAFCIIGHLYPVYFGFRGGKGIMATLGMMLVIDWRVALLGLAAFVLVVLITRYVSLGSIVAVIVAVVMTFVFRYWVDGYPLSLSLGCLFSAVVMAVLVIARHAPNIQRLIAGTESKISFSSRKKKED